MKTTFLTFLSLASAILAFDQLVLTDVNEKPRLIKTSEDKPAEWMTQSDINKLYMLKIKFVDLTDHQDWDSLPVPQKYAIPETLSEDSFADDVKINTEFMKRTLKKLTSFRTRFYRSQTGKESQQYLLSVVEGLLDGATPDMHLTVTTFEHSWPQSSIIARFQGRNPALRNETVIIGAHQDSVNAWLPAFGRAPGADDDGSGTVTILEVFRSLIEGKFEPQRSVEFHWYAAEEGGLLGSQDVAQAYRKLGKNVVGMLQTDMTGFDAKNGVIGIVTDFTDKDLTAFLHKCVLKYSTLKPHYMQCGYGCSDHASWNKAGYRSAFHFETDNLQDNPYVHSPKDVVENLSFGHMEQFAKVALGFATQLAAGHK